MFNESIPLSAPIEFINIVPFNPSISKCQIKVCWVGDEPNPNDSIITKETAYKLANSIPGSPIVGYYNEDKEDFESHNKIIEIRNGKITLKPTTKPFGFVDLGAKVWFQKFMDNGVEREYLVTEGWLWTRQFPECQRILEKGNPQSMELDNELIDAHWTKDYNGNNKFFIINEAIMSKLCILGEDVAPAFEGANITSPKIEFSYDEDFKYQMFSMMKEIKNMIEGGANEMQNEKKKEEEVCPDCGKPISECTCKDEKKPVENAKAETPEKEEKKEETCPECGKPISECTCKKEEKEEFACGDEEEKKKKEFSANEEQVEVTSDEPVQYNLDEIPEYTELKNSYEALKSEYESLKSVNAELSEFKNKIEKAEKETMINKFSMLSDEEKKDVVEHIDEYSLDDIEAKLSVICVRNKISFEQEKKEEPIVYNLNETGTDTNTDEGPSWLSAVISVSKNK